MNTEAKVYGVIPVYRDKDRWKFLLIECQSGHWGFPKGHAEGNENPVNAALRELKEETGVSDVSLIPNISFHEQFDTHTEGGRTHLKTIEYFLGIVTDSSVKIGDTDEIAEYKWCYFPEALETITYQETKKILLEAKHYLEQEKLGEV